MTKPTILVGTWDDGLFAVTGDGCRQEIAGLSVRGLAPDGGGRALAVVGGNSLRRRASSGEWSTVTATEFELSGGYIKNAVVRAAVIASRAGRTMTADDLWAGAHHEYVEMGKVMPSI